MATNCTKPAPEREKSPQPDIGRVYAAPEDYRAAMSESQTMLRALPPSRRDQMLYMIGLMKADPRNPDRDIKGALASFQELTALYPSSIRYDEARTWSSLLEQIIHLEQEYTAAAEKSLILLAKSEKLANCCTTQEELISLLRRKITQLNSQIERLKLIDLGIEEKKREQQRNQNEERSENE